MISVAKKWEFVSRDVAPHPSYNQFYTWKSIFQCLQKLYILLMWELRMEASAHLQQGSCAPVDLRPAARGLGDPRQDLQECALAGAVASDKTDHFALVDFERHVFEGPEGPPPAVQGRRSRGLRVCLIRGDSGQAANHEVDHRHLDDGFTGFRQQFVIFTQAAVAIEPAEGALDNPPLWNHDKALRFVRALGNLQADRPLRSQRPNPGHQRPGIGPIGP